jgi:PAS domain S-box-containing protein
MSTETESRSLVLIVEDDPGIAILERRRLERAGFLVAVANDLEGAMTVLSRGGVSVVLLDYRLGETTGLDLHRRMRASGIEVPVILISAAMEDAAVIEALRAGIRDVIVKTHDYLDILPDTVRGVLAQGAAVAGSGMRGHGRSQILIVDAEAEKAELARQRLVRSGYAVQIAGTAEDALTAVRRGNLALVLIEAQLPGGRSGLDLYDQWRAEGLVVPAILVTGYTDQAIVIRALRIGIRDFVPKTAGFVDELPAAVDRVMSQIHAEHKLAESEMRLASVIGTTLDAILMCDATGRIVLANEAAHSLFERTGPDLLATSLQTLIPGLELPSAVTPGQFRQRLELDGVRRSGERVPIEVSVTDVLIQQQQLFTVIARDISERRRIEEERREADRRKDEFLGMLGHELRNPLSAILSAGEILHRSVPESAAQRFVDVVRRQSRALARMVDDLLDLSRVTLGKIELSRELVRLDQSITRALDGVRDAAASARLDLVAQLAQTPLWLDADATRLEQVLTNLLTNAIKFTPAGGRITVTTSSEGAEAVVRVTDTGVGMPAALLPSVFDLFVQGDSSLDRSRSGLGIGLALVRQIVALHGGTVTAESEGPERGSTFTVRLPLAAEPMQTADDADNRHTLHPHRARHLQVLIVDDQEDVADATAALAEALGHDVHTAYDGASALAFARRQRVDVIVADIGMPEMSGYDLAMHVRRDPALRHLKLVALTGYGRDRDHARVMSSGFDLHLTKPVTADELQSAFDEFCAEHR